MCLKLFIIVMTKSSGIVCDRSLFIKFHQTPFPDCTMLGKQTPGQIPSGSTVDFYVVNPTLHRPPKSSGGRPGERQLGQLPHRLEKASYMWLIIVPGKCVCFPDRVGERLNNPHSPQPLICTVYRHCPPTCQISLVRRVCRCCMFLNLDLLSRLKCARVRNPRNWCCCC